MFIKKGDTESDDVYKKLFLFTQQRYAGRSRRNVVIKGTDLTVFKSGDEDRANMFDTFREVGIIVFK